MNAPATLPALPYADCLPYGQHAPLNARRYAIARCNLLASIRQARWHARQPLPLETGAVYAGRIDLCRKRLANLRAAYAHARATLPRLEFALIISGPHAPTPAPRVAAVHAAIVGTYHPATESLVRPSYEETRAALPLALRRFVKPGQALEFWHDKAARFEGGRIVGGNLPRLDIRNASGDLVANVYAALCEVPA